MCRYLQGLAKQGAHAQGLQNGTRQIYISSPLRAPIAVGVTLVSNRDLMEDGMRGKGVMIYHVHTDLLWYVFNNIDLTVLKQEYSV